MQYIKLQKLVPAYVKTPELHCHFGKMESEDLTQK